MVGPTVLLQALGLTALHSLWQGALLALALWIVLRATPSPSTRHLAGMIALLALSAASAITFGVELHLGMVSRLAAPGSQAGANALGIGTHADPGLIGLIGLFWAAGAMARGGLMAGGWLRVRRLRRPAAETTDQHRVLVGSLVRRAGVSRSVRLVLSDQAPGPFTVGHFRPLVVVPLGLLTGLTPSALEAVLAHEIAHIRRYDFLWNTVQRALDALFFFHPAVWWISRQVSLERECAADRLAAHGLLGDPLGYAQALTSLEAQRLPAMALVPAGTGGSFMERIRRIAGKPPSASAPWPTPALSLLAVLVALACGLPTEQGSEAGLSQKLALDKADADVTLDEGWATPEAIRPYKEIIYEAGCTHSLDPELIAAVAIVESNGDPEALSTVGAVGLMQLMPATARRIANERFMPDHEDAKLLDAEYNVDLGAWYLARQLQAFGAGLPAAEAVGLAAAAYNGGPERLRQVLSGEAEHSEETARYQERVVEVWRQLREGWDC